MICGESTGELLKQINKNVKNLQNNIKISLKSVKENDIVNAGTCMTESVLETA